LTDCGRCIASSVVVPASASTTAGGPEEDPDMSAEPADVASDLTALAQRRDRPAGGNRDGVAGACRNAKLASTLFQYRQS
jgi:hypothetical protein